MAKLMYFKFSSHCLLFSAILVLIRLTSVECILSMLPFDCGWNAVVLICRMFNAFSNCVINSDKKFDPWSESIVLGTPKV